MNKKISFPIAIAIIVVLAVLTVFIVWQYGLISEIRPNGSLPRPSVKEVTITTDKIEYERGETVNIIVKNNLSKPIWYFVGYDVEMWPWWNLEKNNNGNWEKVGILGQSTVDGKKECILKLYEVRIIKDLITNLEPGAEITNEWNFGTCHQIGTSTGLEFKFIEPGIYRLSFGYAPDKETYLTEKYKEKIITVYSDEFTVKEKEWTFKYCNSNEDCFLWLCTGCVNKEWAETAPPEPPCAIYADYSGCKCIDNKCMEIK